MLEAREKCLMIKNLSIRITYYIDTYYKIIIKDHYNI